MRLALTFLTLAALAFAQAPNAAKTPAPKGSPSKMTMTTARGTFDIKTYPQKPDNPQEEATGFGRLTSDKQFHGDLDATSQGVMLASGTGAPGSSGGYVAFEKVTGKLHGRAGSFLFQHSGTMSRGATSMSVTVVPDSGTGELTGITGKMKIIIEGKTHSYEFEYALPAAASK